MHACVCILVEDEGATPVKRRRVSSDDDRVGEPAPLCSSSLPPCSEVKPDQQEALTPTSTSDTETRDSSSLIDPGTEQDPPTPDPAPSGNLDMSPKEEKMEASSSSSSFSSSSSLLQEAGEGLVQGEEPEAPPGAEGGAAPAAESEEEKADSKAGSSLAPPHSEDATFSSSLDTVGEGPEYSSGHAPSPQAFLSAGPPADMLDMLYRTVEAAITIVTKLSVKGPPSS